MFESDSQSVSDSLSASHGIRVGSKKLAHEAARQIEAKLTPPECGLVKKEYPTFREYAEKSMAGYATTSLKPASKAGNAGELKNHILPCFVRKKLDHITSAHAKDFVYQESAVGLSGSSVRKYLAFFRSIIEHAVDN